MLSPPNMCNLCWRNTCRGARLDSGLAPERTRGRRKHESNRKHLGMGSGLYTHVEQPYLYTHVEQPHLYKLQEQSSSANACHAPCMACRHAGPALCTWLNREYVQLYVRQNERMRQCWAGASSWCVPSELMLRERRVRRFCASGRHSIGKPTDDSDRWCRALGLTAAATVGLVLRDAMARLPDGRANAATRLWHRRGARWTACTSACCLHRGCR